MSKHYAATKFFLSPSSSVESESSLLATLVLHCDKHHPLLLNSNLKSLAGEFPYLLAKNFRQTVTSSLPALLIPVLAHYLHSTSSWDFYATAAPHSCTPKQLCCISRIVSDPSKIDGLRTGSGRVLFSALVHYLSTPMPRTRQQTPEASDSESGLQQNGRKASNLSDIDEELSPFRTPTVGRVSGARKPEESGTPISGSVEGRDLRAAVDSVATQMQNHVLTSPARDLLRIAEQIHFRLTTNCPKPMLFEGFSAEQKLQTVVDLKTMLKEIDDILCDNISTLANEVGTTDGSGPIEGLDAASVVLMWSALHDKADPVLKDMKKVAECFLQRKAEAGILSGLSEKAELAWRLSYLPKISADNAESVAGLIRVFFPELQFGPSVSGLLAQWLYAGGLNGYNFAPQGLQDELSRYSSPTDVIRVRVMNIIRNPPDPQTGKRTAVDRDELKVFLSKNLSMGDKKPTIVSTSVFSNTPPEPVTDEEAPGVSTGRVKWPDLQLQGVAELQLNRRIMDQILGKGPSMSLGGNPTIPEQRTELTLAQKGQASILCLVRTKEYEGLTQVHYALQLTHMALERSLHYQIDMACIAKNYRPCVMAVVISATLWDRSGGRNTAKWTINVGHKNAYVNVCFRSAEDALWALNHLGSFTLSENADSALGLIHFEARLIKVPSFKYGNDTADEGTSRGNDLFMLWIRNVPDSITTHLRTFLGNMQFQSYPSLKSAWKQEWWNDLRVQHLSFQMTKTKASSNARLDISQPLGLSFNSDADRTKVRLLLEGVDDDSEVSTGLTSELRARLVENRLPLCFGLSTDLNSSLEYDESILTKKEFFDMERARTSVGRATNQQLSQTPQTFEYSKPKPNPAPPPAPSLAPAPQIGHDASTSENSAFSKLADALVQCINNNTQAQREMQMAQKEMQESNQRFIAQMLQSNKDMIQAASRPRLEPPGSALAGLDDSTHSRFDLLDDEIEVLPDIDEFFLPKEKWDRTMRASMGVGYFDEPILNNCTRDLLQALGRGHEVLIPFPVKTPGKLPGEWYPFEQLTNHRHAGDSNWLARVAPSPVWYRGLQGWYIITGLISRGKMEVKFDQGLQCYKATASEQLRKKLKREEGEGRSSQAPPSGNEVEPGLFNVRASPGK